MAKPHGRQSPPLNYNKRPSYLDITMSHPNNNCFDEGVIRKLEPQFDSTSQELNMELSDKEEEFEQTRTYLASPKQGKTNNPSKFDDFKKPKPIQKENVSEAEYQKAINKNLRETILHLETELMLRDKALDSLQGRLKTVEAETREQMLLDMDARMQSVRDR